MSGEVARRMLATVQTDAWVRWQTRLLAGFRPPQAGEPAPAVEPAPKNEPARDMEPPMHFDDLVLATARQLPSMLFRMPLDRMDALGWSTLVLEGANTAATLSATAAGLAVPQPPVWGVIAGLRALRFDGGLLSQLAKVLDDATADAFARDAPPAEPGVLIVLRNPALAGALASTDIPLLMMLESDGTRYDAALSWLEANGVVSLGETVKDER